VACRPARGCELLYLLSSEADNNPSHIKDGAQEGPSHRCRFALRDGDQPLGVVVRPIDQFVYEVRFNEITGKACFNEQGDASGIVPLVY
jgi:hypothetical protein